ncbi:hypothetical protein HDZ31DRAFT_7278, partial [Schizophyllum fasciatum]
MSSSVKAKLQEFWHRYIYLVVDEFSMIPKIFLAKLSLHVAIGKNALDQGSFGANRLYHPHQPTDSSWMTAGRNIYEEFNVVVILCEQMRVADPVWHGFLKKLRSGNVTEADLMILDDLPFLVTPRHGVRMEWNEAALRRHCSLTKTTLYICPALDRRKSGRQLTLAERMVFAQHLRQKGVTKQLPRNVELAIGATVLVTQNIDTDLDITNGARGKVVSVILHPDEPEHAGMSVMKLLFPPSCILVKMDRTR